MYRFPDIFMILCTDQPCDQYIAADAQTVEKSDHQKTQRSGRANCRQRLFTGKPSYNDRIRRIEEHLQQRRDHNWNRKRPKIFHQRSMDHIHRPRIV